MIVRAVSVVARHNPKSLVPIATTVQSIKNSLALKSQSTNEGRGLGLMATNEISDAEQILSF